jgi:hypothetical protein
MDKVEIDLREKIADEIETFIKTNSANYKTAEEQEYIAGLWRAIGVVRNPIWHGAQCPCTKCVALYTDKCVICAETATDKFFGKMLCAYHYDLSKH